MLITCPSCASAYDLPADRIGASGRKVRCASCRESWFVASPEDNPRAPLPSLEPEPQAEIVARPLPPPPPREDPEPKPRGRGASRKRAGGGPTPGRARSGVLARVAGIAVVCGMLPGLLAFREKVVSALPGTASLYRSVGLPVNLVGLSFANVRSGLSQERETQVLEVSGEIVNDGRVARPVPSLRIVIEGERGEQLYSWTAKAAEGELSVGKSAPFRVRLTAPPPDARRVEVTFREDRERRSAAAR